MVTDRKPLRIYYAAGPGNVIGTYRLWKEGQDDPSQVNMTISGSFLDGCRKFGDQAYVACQLVQESSYDESQGWGAALQAALLPLRVASRRWSYAKSGVSLGWPNHARHARIAAPARVHPGLRTSWAVHSNGSPNHAEIQKN